MGWPKTFSGLNSGTGVNDRLAIRQAEKTCIDRMTLLKPYVARLCNWAIAKMLKNGYIDVSLPEDWFSCEFSKPKALSVDLARDSKAIIEEYKLNIKTLTQILADDGRDLREHVLERMTEEAIIKVTKQQVEKEYGVELENSDYRLLNAVQLQNENQPV